MPAPKLGPDNGRTLRSLGALSAVGLSFVVAVVIGAGRATCSTAGSSTSPWLFLLCFFLGLAAGMRTVFRTVAAISKSDE